MIAPGGGQTVKNGTNEGTNGDDGGGGGGGNVDGGWRDDDSNVAWDLDKGNFPFSATLQPIVGHNHELWHRPWLTVNGVPATCWEPYIGQLVLPRKLNNGTLTALLC